MKDFKKLMVWEKAHKVTLEVYRATEGFPATERYALTSQLRRAAYSVPTNIAEACGRNTDAEFARFLDIAMGSACEVEYLLLLSKDLGYLTLNDYTRLSEGIIEVKKMTASFIQRMRGGKKSSDRRPLSTEGRI